MPITTERTVTWSEGRHRIFTDVSEEILDIHESVSSLMALLDGVRDDNEQFDPKVDAIRRYLKPVAEKIEMQNIHLQRLGDNIRAELRGETGEEGEA